MISADFEPILQQSELFSNLASTELQQLAAATDLLHFPSGSIIFCQGDAADAVYVIVRGAVQVFTFNKNGQEIVLTRLGAASHFGEQALLAGGSGRRHASVRACEDVDLLKVSKEVFERLLLRQQSPELRQYANSLEKVYQLPPRGFLTQYLGSFLDRDCLITKYHLFDGRSATVTQVIGQDLYQLVIGEADQQAVETVRYEAANGLERVLQIANSKIVGLTVRGQWDDLGKVQEYALDGLAFHPWQAAVFHQKGTLQLEEKPSFFEDGEVVCSCVQVGRGRLRQAIREGQQTVEALSAVTGAGTVCGSCMVQLQEMVGRADWTPVKIVWTRDLTDDIRAFRLVPTSGTVKPSRPGQHLVVQAEIDGQWVRRAFTLSSDSQETDHYEITVQREPYGMFTRWLFNQRPNTAMIQVSSPQGSYYYDATESRPCICLVAGIGVTPAVAICRSMLRNGDDRRLHIDYSAKTPGRLAYGDELEEATRKSRNITVTRRVTVRDGHLTQADIEGLTREFPDGVYFLCGPSAYRRAVEDYLQASGVPPERIRIEVFTHAGGPPSAVTPGAIPPSLPRPPDTGAGPGFGMVDAAKPLPPLEEARQYLHWFYHEKGVPEAFASRWTQVEGEFRATGSYTQTFDEVSYGAKVAWRNSTRCIGRLFWQGLQVRDLRHLTTEDEVFEALVDHIRLATNGGNIRAMISIFAPGLPGEAPLRIWNPLALRYAGYPQSDGSVVGDPAQIELTQQVLHYGWKGARGTPFDVLPLLIQRRGQPPKLFELPKEIILEVSIEHPQYPCFAELELKWFALPMICDFSLEAGGVHYPCAPFNGYYMGTEIGARNFGDVGRYNLLPRVAAGLGLDTRSDRTLWKDRALVELNVAVLYSFEKRGVTMVDHHRAAQDFMRFAEVERAAGRTPNADWSWIIPPLSPSSVPVWNVNWAEAVLKPNYFPQPKPWRAD